MNFQKINRIEKPETYIQKALKKSRKGRKIKTQDKKKKKKLEVLQQIKIFKDSLFDDFKKIVEGFPSFDELNPFYRDLIDSQLELNKLKSELAKISWIKEKIIKIFKDYYNRIKILDSTTKIERNQKEFYGRISSIIKKSKSIFEFLEKSRIKMRNFPTVKTKIPTICISGFPNVGKSTLLKKLTGRNVNIQPYAFTTKNLLVGYIGKKLQIIDTPGTLNRFNKMNLIEKQAYLALKYLAKKIIFVIDLTETCGYEINLQKKLLFQLRKDFPKIEILVFFSKMDIIREDYSSYIKNNFKNFRNFKEVKLLKEYITL